MDRSSQLIGRCPCLSLPICHAISLIHDAGPCVYPMISGLRLPAVASLVTPLSLDLSLAGSPAHSLQHRRAGTLARSRKSTDTRAHTRAPVRFLRPRVLAAPPGWPSTAKHKARDARRPHNSSTPEETPVVLVLFHRHVRASCRPAGAFISAPSS